MTANSRPLTEGKRKKCHIQQTARVQRAESIAHFHYETIHKQKLVLQNVASEKLQCLEVTEPSR